MTLVKRIAFCAAPVVLAGAWIAKDWRSSAPPPESPPYSFLDHRIRLAPGSRMLGRLEMLQLDKAVEENTPLRSVGRIIALSNTSGNLTGDTIGWVELDPRLSASAGLHLGRSRAERSGIAYGLTTLAEEYAPRIRAGQPIEIMRYGLRKSSVPAAISKVISRAAEGDGVDVVFRLARAQDWFPGTNCEVLFPHLQGHPIRIPTTAPIHAGTQEYVWKEVGPGEFAAQSVSVIDATPDDVSVLGLKPGDRIVARGAILLKPLLEPLLSVPKEKG